MQNKIRVPHVERGRFVNYIGESRYKFLLKSVMGLGATVLRRRFQGSVTEKMGIELHDYAQPHESLRVIWIGHSTFLIELGGAAILTDPIFGNPTVFFPRNVPPALSLEALPPLDAMLISHNHFDHMHGQTMVNLKPAFDKYDTALLVPQGDERWFERRGYRNAHGFTWGQQKVVKTRSGAEITFTFLPARHWSGRWLLFDYNKSLWGSWMIEGAGWRLYFAGDTAYDTHFQEVQQAFGRIDVAFMPIGPCEPRSWMKVVHMDAYEAGQAFLDLQAQHFIPMHWGTFNLGYDRIQDPIIHLRQWWGRQESLSQELHIMNIGQRLGFTQPTAQQTQVMIER